MAIFGRDLEETTALLRERLGDLLPAYEIIDAAPIVHEINTLKAEKKVIILGHNYMDLLVYHGVSDIQGDSLQLAQSAKDNKEAEIILFCGVSFMAETAKILNPQKKVLIPNHTGCSLAHSITGEQVRKLKEAFPGYPVVSYINCYADVKAESDVICTSSNAGKIVGSFGNCIFIPDEFLAQNVAKETGKTLRCFTESGGQIKELQEKVLDPGLNNEIITWAGRCEVHEQFTVEDISRARKHHPSIKILAHPECTNEVVAASDYSGSTSKMIKFVEENRNNEFMLLTECSMADNISAEVREAKFHKACSVRCPHMAKITLQETLRSIKEETFEIQVDDDTIERSLRSINRMFDF